MSYFMRDVKNLPAQEPSAREVVAILAGSAITALGFLAFILFFLSLGAP